MIISRGHGNYFAEVNLGYTASQKYPKQQSKTSSQGRQHCSPLHARSRRPFNITLFKHLKFILFFAKINTFDFSETKTIITGITYITVHKRLSSNA